MKKLILLELCLLFLATTFQGDRMTGWVQQTIPREDIPIVDLQFLDTLTGFMVSSKSTPDSAFIFKTTDSGNNWMTVVKDKHILTSIHFPSHLTGYCVGLNIPTAMAIVLKTTNSGDNWNVVSTLPSNILDDVCFVNNDTGWVCDNSGLLGGLWRTTNGGLNWQMQMNASNGPSKIFFIDSNTGWVIGSANSGLYKTTNCGEIWSLLTYIPSSDVYFASIDTGWVIGGSSGNGMMKTTNGGSTWFATNNPSVPTESRLHFLNNTTGWIGSSPNKIFATKNGFNWGTQYSPRYSSFNINFADSLHGWAGYSGLVYTTDGGGPITYSGIKRNGDFVPSFELGQNYPNPFNASTRLNFSILKPCYLDLIIYNITGKEIARVISGKRYDIGDYDLYFDAGKYSITSGVYFYLMKGATTDNREIFLDTKKMLLIK